MKRTKKLTMFVYNPKAGGHVLANVTVSMQPVGEIGDAISIVATTEAGETVDLTASEAAYACRGL